MANQFKTNCKEHLLNSAATLCYCDDFCERGRNGDCCPDYDSYCLNITAPEPIKQCQRNGRVYPPLVKFKDNCNTWY